MIAALYVETGGVYYGIEGVDPWDEERDARLYAGPWAVVAHPPCKTWYTMANCRPLTSSMDDGGCFEAALAAVEKYGGVLEHPANTRAWRAFNLPKVAVHGWNIALHGRPGWSTEVDQAQYGHSANKRTWLYFVGRSKTPPAFRDALLDIARSAQVDTQAEEG